MICFSFANQEMFKFLNISFIALLVMYFSTFCEDGCYIIKGSRKLEVMYDFKWKRVIKFKQNPEYIQTRCFLEYGKSVNK